MQNNNLALLTSTGGDCGDKRGEGAQATLSWVVKLDAWMDTENHTSRRHSLCILFPSCALPVAFGTHPTPL